MLKDINLEVAKSEVVVILGPSGCGKSTLLRCINGLESIASGAIYIDGTKIDKDFKEWIKIRQKVGMVFQSYELFEHLSVEENILLAPMKAQARPKGWFSAQNSRLSQRVKRWAKATHSHSAKPLYEP